MSSKTDEKRTEFAEWTAKHLEQGFIPWQSPSAPSAAPESAVSGRSYKGLNALYLLKPIREEGFTDSRWITEKDANKLGCKVKEEAEGASLEYWGTRDGKTGTHSYAVFNVEQLDSFPVRDPDVRPNYDRADAILKNAGSAIPESRDENAYSAALGKSLADASAKTPLFNDVHTQDLKVLRLAIANTFLMWETHIRTTQDISKTTTQSWAASFRHNPAELFKAIRDAGKLIGEMTKGLEHEQPGTAERQTVPERKNKTVIPKVGDRVTFRAKGSGENRVPALTGEVVGVDDSKGTVSMQCGEKIVPVFRGKGYFFEAPPLKQEETKEYAQNLAQKRVGENGQVFFARDEGLYKGVVEMTPTFALQEVNRKTIVLHRLKDLGRDGESQIQKGSDIAIHKEAGKTAVSLNQVQEQRETAGVER